MESKFCINASVCEIEGVQIGTPKRHIVMADKGRKKRKLAHEIDDFNSPPSDIIGLNEKVLTNPTVRRVLGILEERSKDNNGDTKIYNSRIAKIIGKSEKTVQRAILTLRQHGFIAVHMVRSSKNDMHLVKTDRVIRCWRIFAYCGMYPYQRPKWKTDPRPKHDAEKIRQRSPSLLWEPPKFVTVEIVNKEGITVKKKQKAPEIEQSEGYLYRLGLFPELIERCMIRNDMRNANDGESIDICGYNGFQRFISAKNREWKQGLLDRGLTPARARHIRKVRTALREEISRVTERVRVLDYRQGLVQNTAHEALKSDDFSTYADAVLKNQELNDQIAEMRQNLSEMAERHKQLVEERHGLVPSFKT